MHKVLLTHEWMPLIPLMYTALFVTNTNLAKSTILDDLETILKLIPSVTKVASTPHALL